MVDDGSSDGTGEIAGDLGCAVLSGEGRGAAAARRAGLAAVHSPLLCFLDADDELLAGGVNASLGLLHRRSELIGAAGVTMRIGETGIAVASTPRQGNISLIPALRDGFTPGPPGSIIWRTEVVREAYARRPPPLAPRYAEDYELFLRCLLSGQLGTHAVPSCTYRAVGGKSAKVPEGSIRSAIALTNFYADLLGLSVAPRKKRHVDARIALRKAQAENNNRLALILQASLGDPILMARLAAQKLAARLRQEQRGGFE